MVSRAVSVPGLSRRESWWKDAEILMLRHQLAVAQRERPRAGSRLAWPDRAWLALLAGTLPAGRLAAMRLIVTPGTIMRWHRDIVRRRRARVSQGRSGRPPAHRTVRSWVLRLAGGNECWGCRRIHGERAGLGITVAPCTVWQILNSAGIDPVPRRDGPGGCLCSCGPRRRGSWRWTCSPPACSTAPRSMSWPSSSTTPGRVRVLGATGHPVQAWVVQQAGNLLMDLEDTGTRVKFVLHDRDASFTAAFDAVFQAAGVRIVRSAVQAPRMNSVRERWIGSCRRELLDPTLIWNQRHLMIVLREYEDFGTTRRPHRALSQAAPLRPLPDGVTGQDQSRIQRRDRGGGVIHEYRLAA